MLWIDYEATTKLDFLFVRQTVENIARLVAPYPVAAIDHGPYGLGLIASNGPVMSLTSDRSEGSDGRVKLDDHSIGKEAQRDVVAPDETETKAAASREQLEVVGTHRPHPTTGAIFPQNELFKEEIRGDGVNNIKELIDNGSDSDGEGRTAQKPRKAFKKK